MTPSLEGWPTKAKEAPSPYEVRLAPLDTNPVFQSLGDASQLAGTNFSIQCVSFFTNHVNQKAVHKTTCRTPPANLH